MAYTHQGETGQVAVCDEEIEFALPFEVAPIVRIVLVVAAEVEVSQGSEVWIERGDLHNARAEGIPDRRGYRTDAADVVHQETVVPDCPTGLQHRIKDVAILQTVGCIGSSVVPNACE